MIFENIKIDCRQDNPGESRYTSLRLEVTVHFALVAYRNRLQASVDSDPPRYPKWMHKQLTLGDALAYLLEQQDGRCRRQRRNRKLRNMSVESPSGPVNGSETGDRVEGQGNGDSPSSSPHSVPESAERVEGSP